MPLFERRVEFEEQNKICCVRKSQEKKTIQIARKEVGETGKEKENHIFFLTFSVFLIAFFFFFHLSWEPKFSNKKDENLEKKK